MTQNGTGLRGMGIGLESSVLPESSKGALKVKLPAVEKMANLAATLKKNEIRARGIFRGG